MNTIPLAQKYIYIASSKPNNPPSFFPSFHVTLLITMLNQKKKKKNNTAIFCQVGDCVEIGIPMLILLIGLSQVLCLMKTSYTNKIQPTLAWPIFYCPIIK